MTTQATKHFIAVFMKVADSYKDVNKHTMQEQLDNIAMLEQLDSMAELALSFAEYTEYVKITLKYFAEKCLINKV